MIAALYVQTGGCYFGLPDVDPWDECRDARTYDGWWPVIAHPPCQRWGRYWYGGPMRHKLGRRCTLGDDQGCFRAALAAVRTWGGVLEHPEASHAFAHHGLAKPARAGGWHPAGDGAGHVCCVEQGHYGHRARKATWLYAVATSLPDLIWGSSTAGVRLDQGFHSKEERRRVQRLGTLRATGVQRLSRHERAATPIAFRDLLIAMAHSVR